MQGLRFDSPAGRHILAGSGEQIFRLVDVGANGGLASGWRTFGDGLRVLAVTGSPTEAGALEAAWPSARVLHERLTPQWPFQPTGLPADLSFLRSLALRSGEAEELSAWLRRRAASSSPANPAPGSALEEATLGGDLAHRISEAGFGEPHFLRVDAGDADFEILSGMEALLRRDSLLGVGVRLRLYGSADPRDNSLHNTDRLLRAHGFQPVVFIPVLFSSAALPAPYMDAYPFHSQSGRPAIAIAVYTRLSSAEFSVAQTAKSAALHALLNLPDVAAQLLLLHRERLERAGVDVAAGLDLLAREAQEQSGGSRSYEDYVAAFETEHPSFFDLHARSSAWIEGLKRRATEAETRAAEVEAANVQMANELYTLKRPLRTPDLVQDSVRSGRLHGGHHWIFDHFRAYRGPQADGLYVDYIGDRSQPEYYGLPPAPALDRFETQIPAVNEEYFEWIDLLQAVLDAGETFTMLELGAGFGRWSVRAALAARQLGKQVRLGLAEAEPKHMRWLKEHLALNGVAPSDYAVYREAVSGSFGRTSLLVDLPAEDRPPVWFGQYTTNLDEAAWPAIGDYHGSALHEGPDGSRFITVPQIPLSRVLQEYEFVDIADFDLQAAEGAAISEAVDQLTAKVRRLHIGTHTHEIEAELRSLLPTHGWICLRDFPCLGISETPFGPCDFTDGVQSWVNPRLL